MKDAARTKIEELVERFSRNIDVYKSGSYNEAQTRREFIEPFFESLGWDVYNRQGYAEQYKDVVHEDSVKVGVSLKAPDYSFRIGGQRKFFLEAKKPSVSIKDDIDPSYQLRRYAWSAKLPLSILTDFEELAVYDCRIKPSPRDRVGTGRIAYYTYKRYVDEFDAVYDVFSRDAVLKGSFDRYAVTTARKRGTAEVDREFLKEIEGWRDSLARNIAVRNPKLTVDEMNFAVQQTIDRIIFLRICEDRGIEQYGSLQALLNGVNTYRRLFELFYQADTKYNSGLFDFSADKLTPEIKIDDDVLKGIIDSLYYPKSPYEFSVLGVDILGNVYEQFLGKVIRLTAGHNAKVEEKPEVKKAGGVYYTPEYIVEYIVQNTVGKLIEGDGSPSPLAGEGRGEGKKGGKSGLTPKEVSHLRILDPACGSGSFLIGAYQYLLSYHLKWYIENSPDKYAKGKFPAVYRSGEGWRLTTQEKKRILLNNIFGVDIDRQAVEVTKLSLLLKVLEDENRETIGKNLLLFRERVLPNLDSNIKCGNSLIGTDFYNPPQSPLKLRGDEGGLNDDENLKKTNPFDWHDPEKGFGKIMKEGGFDVVIGNPPYVTAELEGHERAYYSVAYPESTSGKLNTYRLFTHKGLNLLKTNGLLGFIIPNTYLTDRDSQSLRELLLTNSKLKQILFFPEKLKVFKNVTQATTILIFEKGKKGIKNNFVGVIDPVEDTVSLVNNPERFYRQDSFIKTPEQMIATRRTAEQIELIEKIMVLGHSFDLFADIYQGEVNVSIYKDVIAETPKNKNYRPLVRGNNISRYYVDLSFSDKKGSWVDSTKPFRPHQNQTRIVTQEVSNMQQKRRLNGALIGKGIYVGHTANYILLKNSNYSPNYFVALLNSFLLDFIFQTFNSTNHIPARELKRLPIRTIDFNNKKEKAMHDQMVSLVDKMLDLNNKLKKAKTPHDRELIERQIKATDNQIDRLIYELYGLMEEEIRVVEGEK